MSRVIAAITGDSAAEAVLSTATAVGKLFGAEVEALHVGSERLGLASAARRAGMAIKSIPGESLQTLADAASAEDVVAVVIGARAEPAGKRPAGSTALRLITRQLRPVVVVPPDAPRRRAIESVLVPLDGTPASAAALAETIELAHNAALRVVVAHVHPANTIPAFSNHLPHEVRAWSEEFIARQCPAAAEATLELRIGEPHEHVLGILRESGCDLIALGWRQDLGSGHAAVVRRILAESPVPVLLTPVGVARSEPPTAAGHATRSARS